MGSVSRLNASPSTYVDSMPKEIRQLRRRRGLVTGYRVFQGRRFVLCWPTVNCAGIQWFEQYTSPCVSGVGVEIETLCFALFCTALFAISGKGHHNGVQTEGAPFGIFRAGPGLVMAGLVMYQ